MGSSNFPERDSLLSKYTLDFPPLQFYLMNLKPTLTPVGEIKFKIDIKVFFEGFVSIYLLLVLNRFFY